MFLDRGEDLVVPETRVHHRTVTAILMGLNTGMKMSQMNVDVPSHVRLSLNFQCKDLHAHFLPEHRQLQKGIQDGQKGSETYSNSEKRDRSPET